MAMVSVKGILTEDGKIEVDLLEGWQAGEIRVEVQIEPVYTEEELDELIQFNPKPANEIQTGGWEDAGIEDSVEFVENLRRKRREKNQW